MIRNIEDWVETTDGIYKYEIADTLYYELHIYSRYMKDDIQDALASLYLVSKQFSGSVDNIKKFERIGLSFNHSVMDCLNQIRMPFREFAEIVYENRYSHYNDSTLVPKSETIIVAFARMPDDIRESKWEERVELLAYAFAYELRNKRVSKF